ncbi:MFS transporter [Rhizobium sp. XQZ8]|uniref:MFS transporter n=1 Tax=Rhizobium populisoli TaxID=2859785 RepID=UPI001C679D8D|nr:MFS transporter [Rhizobium populisoli]MBW6423809.1 MFS transporter [Rhizobium populisoli]
MSTQTNLPETVDEISGEKPAQTGALMALSLCMLLSSLGTSIANVGLPTFTAAFGASFQETEWIVIAYLLASTTLIVSIGRLGDMIGRRRLLLAGIIAFTAASVLCSLAPGLWPLVAARALQGLGAAAMMALAMALVGEAVPKEKTGSAMGLLGTTSAIGTALGPSLGGLLISSFGWPSIFLLNLPLGATAFLLVWRSLSADPIRKSEGARQFDIAGTMLLAATLAAYALAMTLGRNSFGILNIVLLGMALLGALAFMTVETRAASPLIRLSLLREPALGSGLAMSVLVATVMMATLVVGPFYLSRSLSLDPAWTGIILSAGPAISTLSGIPAGRLIDRLGASSAIVASLAVMIAGCIGLALLPGLFGIAGYLVAIAVLTPGYQLFQAANNTAIMQDIEPGRRGLVSGLVNLSRNLGLITGASAMGAVFAFASGAADISLAGREAIAGGMRTTFLVAAALVFLAFGLAIKGRVSSAGAVKRQGK